MAIALQGLKVRRQFEDLIGVAFSNGLDNIKFPNRNASCLKNGFVMSQLDGEGMRTMERQQEMASKGSYKEHLLKQIATNTGANIHDLGNDSHQELRTDRINQALNPQFYNRSQSDHEMEPMHSLPPSDETEIRDDMSTRTMPLSETTYPPSLNSRQAMSDNVANQSSAVADLTGEIERQRLIAENELRQQDIRQTRQLEIVRQGAAPVLQSTTQALTKAHRNEATSSIAYVTKLTENALNKLNKENREKTTDGIE